MLLLIESVQFGIVGFAVGEHAKQDFKQPLAQAPQGAGMTHALFALLVIVGLAPAAGAAETVGPQMDGMAHELVAGAAHTGPIDLAGLVINRGGTGQALEHLMGTVTGRIAANSGQEPWGQDFPGSGEAAKQVVMGMVAEEGLDLLAVLFQLLLQGAQQLAEAQRQLALGRYDRTGGLELIGLGENGQAVTLHEIL